MSGNVEAFSALQGAIDGLAALGALPSDVAAAAVEPLRKLLTANIEEGVAPNGKPWPLTADGKKALRNAAKALTVKSSGATIIATLTGVEARHNFGNVKGKVKRQILPTRNSIGGVAKILQQISAAKFAERTGGAQ